MESEIGERESRDQRDNDDIASALARDHLAGDQRGEDDEECDVDRGGERTSQPSGEQHRKPPRRHNPPARLAFPRRQASVPSSSGSPSSGSRDDRRDIAEDHLMRVPVDGRERRAQLDLASKSASRARCDESPDSAPRRTDGSPGSKGLRLPSPLRFGGAIVGVELMACRSLRAARPAAGALRPEMRDRRRASVAARIRSRQFARQTQRARRPGAASALDSPWRAPVRPCGPGRRQCKAARFETTAADALPSVSVSSCLIGCWALVADEVGRTLPGVKLATFRFAGRRCAKLWSGGATSLDVASRPTLTSMTGAKPRRQRRLLARQPDAQMRRRFADEQPPARASRMKSTT